MNEKEKICRVCSSKEIVFFCRIKEISYWRCNNCKATLMDSSCLPDKKTEKERYMLHENNPEDKDYRKFVKKLADPLLEQLSTSKKGLDYGCGPNPALPYILSNKSHSVELYDPLFYPDKSVLNRTYDFIFCSEVVEHFHFPQKEFTKFNQLLKRGGWLSIMTCFQTEDKRFTNWHYRRDLTHVTFYKKQTFHHIAKQYGWKYKIPEKNVVLMHKIKNDISTDT